MQPDTNSPDTCIESATAADLLQLMSVDDEADMWSEDDLSSIWQHQLGADLLQDFNEALSNTETSELSPKRTIGDIVGALESSGAPDMNTINDLKRFAKSCSKKQNCHLPQDICAALYYLSIASALYWHNKRITKLSDESLRQGMEWALGRNWLDKKTLKLFQKCADMVG